MTVNELYNSALELLALKNSDGSENEDCADYGNRALGLVNLLLAETLWLDRIIKRDNSVMPVYVNETSAPLQCNDTLARAVLPYGLAALLVADDDVAMHKLMTERYQNAAKTLKEEAGSIRHDIADCYRYNE